MRRDLTLKVTITFKRREKLRKTKQDNNIEIQKREYTKGQTLEI